MSGSSQRVRSAGSGREWQLALGMLSWEWTRVATRSELVRRGCAPLWLDASGNSHSGVLSADWTQAATRFEVARLEFYASGNSHGLARMTWTRVATRIWAYSTWIGYIMYWRHSTAGVQKQTVRLYSVRKSRCFLRQLRTH